MYPKDKCRWLLHYPSIEITICHFLPLNEIINSTLWSKATVNCSNWGLLPSFSLYIFDSIYGLNVPPVSCGHTSYCKYTFCMILYSTHKWLWENVTLMAMVILRSSCPSQVKSPHDMVWVWKISTELATFPWGRNLKQNNQGVISFVSVQNFILSFKTVMRSVISTQAFHWLGTLR